MTPMLSLPLLSGRGRRSSPADLAGFTFRCDGVHSRVKERLFDGRPAVLAAQGQSFGLSRPSDQVGLMKDTFITRLGAGNYFGGYDIGHGEVLWYVGYNLSRRRRTFAATDITKDYPLPVIQGLTSGWDAPVPRVINGTTRFGARTVEDQPPPRTLAAGRVVLLGDAGRPVQPFSGRVRTCPWKTRSPLPTS